MGQTSLNYLRDNNFRFVKLDGSLVRQVTDNARCREIISSIVSLGSTLGFQVVAEWVENEAIRDHLLTLGCKVYQGYLYSPAIPLKELLAFAQKPMQISSLPKNASASSAQKKLTRFLSLAL